MYLYVMLYWFWAALAYLVRTRRHSRTLAAVFALFLVVFAGTRVDVGCDEMAYSMRYAYMYNGLDWIDALKMGEGGFNWLNMALIHLGASFSALLFACAVVFVSCLYRLASVMQRPLSFLALAFPVLVLQLGMSGLRQALATAFLMLAMASFIDKKRLMCLFWILVASQFHTSSLIFLPIVGLIGRQVSTLRLFMAMILLGPVAVYFLGDRLEIYNDRYVAEIYGEQESEGAWYRYALVLIPFLVFEWKRRLVHAHYPKLFPLLRLFSLITLLLLPVGLVSSVALHRFVFYVMPVSIMALLCIGDTIFEKRSERVGAILPFLAYGAYITTWFTLSSHSASCYIPYQTWLLGAAA